MTAGPVVCQAKLRNRIRVRILAAASLVLVVMGLVLYLLTRQLLHAESTAKSEAMVTVVAASMERWLVEKSAALAALADVEAQYTAPHPVQRASFTMVGHQIGDPPGVYMGYEVAVHDNLKVLLERPGHTAHEAYAKVVACAPSEAVLAFTMLTEEVQAFLATYRTPHEHTEQVLGERLVEDRQEQTGCCLSVAPDLCSVA